MPTSRKKVIVRTLDSALEPGYLPLAHILVDKQVELLNLEGRILSIPLASIRWIAFVRDFNLSDPSDPERLSRRAFLARPRTEGLWLRITLRGGEFLEGLAPLDRTLLDNLICDGGLFLIPPDVRSNTQRLFLPHTAIEALQLLAVITTPSRSRPTPLRNGGLAQASLFPDQKPNPKPDPRSR